MGQVVPMQQRDGLDDLAALGARFTPLREKRPYLKAWPSKGVSSAEKARQWLQKGENVGLITGEASGVVVIDVDPRNGGEMSLLELEQAHGKLPDTLTCQTGGGGLHLYFKDYDGAKSSTPAEGIDFKATVGCVVVPPSVHPDTKALYQWADLDVDVAELPEPWRDAMAKQKGTGVPFSDDGGPIPEGKRNTTLFNIARHLYRNGGGEQRVLAELAAINAERCQPPLDVAEVEQITRQAYRYKPTQQSYLTLWQECLWRSDMDRRELVVGLALASFADVNGKNCFPSQDEVAKRSRYRRQRVSESIAILERAGWLKRFTLRREGDYGWRYSYQLTLPDVPLPDNG